MFESKLVTYPPADARSFSYFENVVRASLQLIAAVLAIAPVPAGSKTPETAKTKGARDDLYRLARKLESIMPNQAAELRYLAR